MKRNVKLLPLIFALLILLGTVGCEKKETPSTNNGGTTLGIDDSQMEYFNNIPAELEGTTVKFATWIDHTSNESADVLVDFTNLTGIKVEMVPITQTDYITKLSALIASNDSPDVIVNNGEWPNIKSLLTPLDETSLDVTDTFWDQDVVKTYTVNGKPYLVNVKNGAWDLASGCVVYNNRIFEDNGITTPATYLQEGRWTLDNFFKTSKELKTVCEGGGVGIAASVFLSAYGKPFVNWDSNAQAFKSNLADPSFMSAWQRLLTARDSGYANVNDDGTRYLFENESLGMLMCGSYGLRKYGWFAKMDVDDLGFVRLPSVDTSSTPAYSQKGDRAYGICKGAKNADGAVYFLRYFLDANNYDEEVLYKNEECAALYKELQNNSTNGISVDNNILAILGGADKPMYNIFPDLKTCSAAQLQTAFSSGKNTFDACIERANNKLVS